MLSPMKRIISILLCIFMLLLPCLVQAEETPVTPISSLGDMRKIAQNPSGRYELTCDIDMSAAETPWTPIPFSGELDGKGHGLYNLRVRTTGADTAETYDGNYKTYETVFGGLFSILDGARLSNLRLVNTTVFVDTDQHCFLGALAGFAQNATIENCTVQTRNHLTLTSINAGVGGLVGFSVESTFTGCTVDAELIFTDMNTDALCEEFLGGIYASGCGVIDHCDARVRGFAEVYGYAHSGGLIGMHKLPKKSQYKSSVSYTTADTEISFFEITKSRRAYCSPTIGEDAGRQCKRLEMITTHYEKYESRKAEWMTPEKCESPRYTSGIVEPTCTEWGYTVYTCTGCGYSYKDEYTAPEHQYQVVETVPSTCTEEGKETLRCSGCGDSFSRALPAAGHKYQETVLEPTCTEAGARVFTCEVCGDSYSEEIPAMGHAPGEWVTSREPEIDVEGEEQQLCSICGAVVETRPLPPIPYTHAERIQLDSEALSLTSGSTGHLAAEVFPADATDHTVSFTSSDETVATARPDGTVLAGKPGTATLTCLSADGRASATCEVTVRYTTWQWVRHYVLFGWLWEE